MHATINEGIRWMRQLPAAVAARVGLATVAIDLSLASLAHDPGTVCLSNANGHEIESKSGACGGALSENGNESAPFSGQYFPDSEST